MATLLSKPTASLASSRHRNSLAEDLIATGPLRTQSKKRKASKFGEDVEVSFIDAISSRKILKIGQELAEEEQESEKLQRPSTAFTFQSRFGASSDQDEDFPYEDAEEWGDEDEDDIREFGMDPKDLDLFNKFIPLGEAPSLDLKRDLVPTVTNGTNLADLILEQIAAHEAKQEDTPTAEEVGSKPAAVELPAKVIEVYSKIGLILSRYKSGKLPKPFKIIPTLSRWDNILELTRPATWTTNACYEATKIFVSSSSHVVQPFLESVILDRVREDINETKKLNVHLYKALQKATYKPAAFFKGILFPLVGSGTCTLKEAHIVSSVLARVSIPVLHSAAALMRLTEIAAEQASVSTEVGGATNIFIRVLLEKKYALPYKVIDNLVFHFLRFRRFENFKDANFIPRPTETDFRDFKLPVLWHQSLLAFAQRYRNDITEDQREALLDLVLIRGHKQIGPEVRRELLEGRGRGTVVEETRHDAGDDTMVLDHV